ncbi:hypothetical protein HDE_03152 [Halotydeus destructor]|nr:hypothetical protein HDE_03152 [Halotydeus destructor]
MQRIRKVFQKRTASTLDAATVAGTKSNLLPIDLRFSGVALSSSDEHNASKELLDIPLGRQVRSASCDQIVFDKAENCNRFSEDRLVMKSTLPSSSASVLDVPSAARSSRSRSFDATAAKLRPRSTKKRPSLTFLEIPKWKLLIRRSSSTSSGRGSPPGSLYERCVHCLLLEEVSSRGMFPFSPQLSPLSQASPGSIASRESWLIDDVYDEQSETDEKGSSSKDDSSLDEDEPRPGSRKWTKCQQRQLDTTFPCSNDQWLVAPGQGIPLVTLSAAPNQQRDSIVSKNMMDEDLGNGVTVISLEVPLLKQTRSASIDASFSRFL